MSSPIVINVEDSLKNLFKKACEKRGESMSGLLKRGMKKVIKSELNIDYKDIPKSIKSNMAKIFDYDEIDTDEYKRGIKINARKRGLSPEIAKKIVLMRHNGKTYDEISKETGVPRTSCARCVKKFMNSEL